MNKKKLRIFAILIGIISFMLISFQNFSPAPNSKRIIIAFGDSRTRGANPLVPTNTGIKGYAPQLQNLLGENVQIINCGIGGQTTRDAKDRFIKLLNGDYMGVDNANSPNCSKDTISGVDTASFYDFSKIQWQVPSEIIIWLGTNNVFLNKRLNFIDAYSDLYQMIKTAKEKIPSIKILLLTVPTYNESFTNNATSLSLNAKLDGNTLNRIVHYNTLIQRLSTEFSNVKLVDVYNILSPSRWSQYNWDGIHLTAEANKLVAAEIYKQMLTPTTIAYPQTSGHLNCNSGTGFLIPDGLFACSCAGGAIGSYYQCKNGVWTLAGKLNQICADYKDGYKLINYHCPVLTSSGCKHLVSGKNFDSSFCKDQVVHY